MRKSKFYFLMLMAGSLSSKANEILFQNNFGKPYPSVYEYLTYINPNNKKVLVVEPLLYETHFSTKDKNWTLEVSLEPSVNISKKVFAQGCKLSMYPQISNITLYMYQKMLEKVTSTHNGTTPNSKTQKEIQEQQDKELSDYLNSDTPSTFRFNFYYENAIHKISKLKNSTSTKCGVVKVTFTPSLKDMDFEQTIPPNMTQFFSKIQTWLTNELRTDMARLIIGLKTSELSMYC